MERVDDGAFRDFPREPFQERPDLEACAFHLDGDAAQVVLDPAHESELLCETVDEGSESDTLNCATQLDPHPFRSHIALISPCPQHGYPVLAHDDARNLAGGPRHGHRAKGHKAARRVVEGGSGRR